MTAAAQSGLETKFVEFRRLADEYWTLLAKINDGAAGRNAPAQIAKLRDDLVMLKPDVRMARRHLGWTTNLS